MSDDDLEEAPFNVWFDSEVDFPDISSVSTIPSSSSNKLGERGTVAETSPGLSVRSQEHYRVERDGDIFLDMVHPRTSRANSGPMPS